MITKWSWNINIYWIHNFQLVKFINYIFKFLHFVCQLWTFAKLYLWLGTTILNIESVFEKHENYELKKKWTKIKIKSNQQ